MPILYRDINNLSIILHSFRSLSVHRYHNEILENEAYEWFFGNLGERVVTSVYLYELVNSVKDFIFIVPR